nr:heterogeneous nuclear ribonucleoprotein A3 [Tanacetum cinerariifolium]
MLFDVVDIDACHIIFGKPWVYDPNVIYKIEDNTYKFKHNGGHGIQKEQMVQNMEGIHGVKKHHVEFDYEEDDMFKFQQIVLFFLGGNSRTSFFKKGRMTQKIFIGGLPKETEYDEFNNHFGKYEDITDFVIMKDRMTGQPRGFGFITYVDPLDVDKVIEDTHVFSGTGKTG